MSSDKYRHWCFTLNNFSEDDVVELQQYSATSKYLVFGKETGDGGTRHLQGFVSFPNPRRVDALRLLFGGRAHWEVARNPLASSIYCKKDGDYQEFGTPPAESRKGQGKRSDILELQRRIDDGERDPKKLRKELPCVCAKYPRFVSQLLVDAIQSPAVKLHPLREWQQELYASLLHEPSDREVIFVVDKDGNGGKSWFIDYYASLNPCKSMVILPGKKADMAYAFLQMIRSELRVVFMDAPRSKQGDFIQYDFLEDLKNGRIFSSKYESQMLRFKTPHVVVMMNEQPDWSKLSEDRYNVIEIN